uniref:Uncharacterized protein n=1 Tax=Oryza nivara TaxID=4536 RepID=A0A0E0G1C8_ORYNI
MLLDDTSSSGKPPDSELWDKLRRIRPVRLPREGEMTPSRPLEARNISVTILFGLQVIPSHAQQSVPFFHDMPRPPSFESPVRNWTSEFLSCSVQELVGEAKKSSSTRAWPRIAHVLLPKIGVISLSSGDGDRRAAAASWSLFRAAVRTSPDNRGLASILSKQETTSFIDIAGLDITVDDMWLAGIMDIRKSPACSLGNFEPLRPVKKLTPQWYKIVMLCHRKCFNLCSEFSFHQAHLTKKLLDGQLGAIRDAELLQKLLGMCPVKLLLLAFSITRFFIISHVADGNCPVNELLEMFSTWRGRTGVEDGSSCISPLRWLKLMSRTVMLLDAINSSGKPPDSELWDRLRRSRPVRLPRDGEIRPSRPLEASETSVTVPSALQVTPSHLQQSAAFRHDTARPPSLERPERNWRRELLSCSVHELVGEARESNSSSAKARLNLRVFGEMLE